MFVIVGCPGGSSPKQGPLRGHTLCSTPFTLPWPPVTAVCEARTRCVPMGSPGFWRVSMGVWWPGRQAVGITWPGMGTISIRVLVWSSGTIPAGSAWFLSRLVMYYSRYTLNMLQSASFSAFHTHQCDQLLHILYNNLITSFSVDTMCFLVRIQFYVKWYS